MCVRLQKAVYIRSTLCCGALESGESRSRAGAQCNFRRGVRARSWRGGARSAAMSLRPEGAELPSALAYSGCRPQYCAVYL